MHDLLQIQESFQNYLLTGNKLINKYIVSDNLKAEQRLKIYFNAYRIRIIDILKLEFSKLYVYLGDDEFIALCLAYLNMFPPTHFSARYVGQNFTKFLQHAHAYRFNPEVLQLAKFEWALSEALDALDADIMTIEELLDIQTEQWPEQSFYLHPAVRLITLDTNVNIIWHEINQNIENITPPKTNLAPVDFVIWRDQSMQVLFRSLNNFESNFVNSLLTKQPFAQVCENLCELCEIDSVPQCAVGILRRLIFDQMIQSNL